MALFGPKSKEYGDLNRKSITEIDHQVEETKEEVKVIQSDPFSGSDPGLVPTSDETTQAKYLRGDGQWGTPAGGGGGTEDYEALANKPAIGGTELTKNSTAEGLGLAKTSDLPDMSKYAKKSEIPDVPTKTSDLDNDSGFLTSETDPTVPSWAKVVAPGCDEGDMDEIVSPLPTGGGGEGEEVASLTLNTTNVAFAGVNRIVKRGRIVHIDLEVLLKEALNPNASWPAVSPILGTIPEGMRIPSDDDYFFFPALVADAGSLSEIHCDATVSIYANGNIRIRQWGSSTIGMTSAMIHITYTLPE